jgi:hypothetical protein
VSASDLFIALLHYPVVDRTGRVVTSAITSLDLHDIARSARTYGVRAFFIVHPIAEQREFATSVIDHWRFDFGRQHDSRRREALELVEIVTDLDAAAAAAERIAGARPTLVHTSSRNQSGMSFAGMRARMEAAGAAPVLLLLGTGFGLAPAVLERADLALEPITGGGDYNHLSVRAAAATMLDRLRGR